jgi:hypothetical protein
MSNESNNEHSTRGKMERENTNTGRSLLLIILLGVAGALVYYTYFGEQSTGVTTIPKAMKVTYVPADFKPNLDDEATLRILSNPQQYRNEFDALVLNFNLSLLGHVCNRMGLSAQTREACFAEYKRQHPYIRQMYFNDFIGLKDTTSNLYESWYENESTSAVALMNEVASKYTCFFVSQVIGTVLKTQDGKLSVKGSKVETPCGVALTEALRPTIERLQKSAAVRDFSRAKGMIKERVERTIAELGVIEIKDRKGIKKNLNTKVMGYNMSSTEIEISAISIAKIGFNLNQVFRLDVDNGNRSVLVTLPQPMILSHEVYPKVDGLSIGWLRELSSEDFNANVNTLRQEFRNDILQSDVMQKARLRADDLMQMLLGPIAKSIDKGYRIKVQFQQTPNADFNLPQPTPQKTPQQRPKN